jgi:4-diphosphocytidyl-2-C-methyl-D-erythritol kinase
LEDARAMKLRAHAKVNLHLRVRGRRADGFHEIETLMAPISLADEITLTTSPGATVKVRCDNPEVPADDSNLAVAAAREFSRCTGMQFSADIEIRKRIPTGAGLAGGSSDAAAVLVALDKIFQTHLGFEKLEQAAANLGSDVPFFVRGVPAVCKGRGEIVEPTVFSQRLKLLLLKPPFSVETPWAYKAWAASSSRLSHGDEQDVDGIKIFNSLEAPVFQRFPLLPEMKDWLKRQPGTRAAAMSGSGSTIFAVLSDGASGPDLEARAKERYGDTLWTTLCDLPA